MISLFIIEPACQCDWQHHSPHDRRIGNNLMGTKQGSLSSCPEENGVWVLICKCACLCMGDCFDLCRTAHVILGKWYWHGGFFSHVGNFINVKTKAHWLNQSLAMDLQNEQKGANN